MPGVQRISESLIRNQMLLPRFINSGDLEKGSKEGGTLEQDKEVRGNAFTSEWLPASTANKGKK